MNEMQALSATIVNSIQSMGYIKFAIVLLVVVILFRIHTLLGLLAAIITFAYLVNWI